MKSNKNIILNFILIVFLILISFSTKAADLKILNDKPGKGIKIINHSKVKVHYLGKLEDGTKFDSSYERGEPLIFQIGIRQVIEGWEKGLLGMKIGGKRTLIIPSELAYGKKGAGNLIPPNATLIFDIEVIDIEPPGYKIVKTNKIHNYLNPNYIFVDIRNNQERSSTGIIPGSLEITAFDKYGNFVSNFLKTFQSKVDLDDNIILVSNTGDISSILANGFVEQLGLKNIYSLEGGIEKLLKEKFKLLKK